MDFQEQTGDPYGTFSLKKKRLKNFLLNISLIILQPKTFLPVYTALQKVRLSVNTTHLVYQLNVSCLPVCPHLNVKCLACEISIMYPDPQIFGKLIPG